MNNRDMLLTAPHLLRLELERIVARALSGLEPIPIATMEGAIDLLGESLESEFEAIVARLRDFRRSEDACLDELLAIAFRISMVLHFGGPNLHSSPRNTQLTSVLTRLQRELRPLVRQVRSMMDEHKTLQ